MIKFFIMFPLYTVAIIPEYMNQGKERLEQTVAGSIKYRPYDKPIYDAKTSALSKIPDEWKEASNENADI